MKHSKFKINQFTRIKALDTFIVIFGLSVFFMVLTSVDSTSNGIHTVQNSTSLYKSDEAGQGNGSVWKAPESANALKNPYAGIAAETAKGKTLYLQMCAACHGNTGKGDGAAAVALNPRPADHTSAKVQSESDGALFWKMTYGNPPMAAYKDILTEEQRWDLVDFIRTLKK